MKQRSVILRSLALLYSDVEAEWVISEVVRYSEASGSKISWNKSERFSLGGGVPGFDLPDTLPGPQDIAKFPSIEFSKLY